MRKIHFLHEVWTYDISAYIIVIRNPQRKRFVIDIAKFLNVNPDVIERSRWKRTGPVITPSMIKSYIEKHLLNKQS